MAYSAVPFHGKLCRIYWEGTSITYTKGWNIDVSLDMADSTAQPDAWKSALPGAAGWGGSFEMYFVAGNAQQILVYTNLITAAPGTKLAGSRFLLDIAANYLSGDFYITGISIGAQMTDVVSSTVTFQGNGALSITE